MARFGKLPVSLPDGVTAEIGEGKVVVKGPKGQLEKSFNARLVNIENKDNELLVNKKGKNKQAEMLRGTMRSHLLNMVNGVTEGWSKSLEINGAGYRAEATGNKLVMNIGYSHPVEINMPENVNVKVEKNIVTVEGADKEVIGQLAAVIRSKRKPEPYKGTGIKYTDEVIRRKAGKQAAKAA